jgi:phosphatidate cytidylyltransferase
VSNFWKRALSGGLFVAAVTGAIFSSPYCFYALFLLFIIVGILEFERMARRLDIHVALPTGLAGGVLLFTAGFLHNQAGERYSDLYLVWLLVTFLIPITELYRQRGIGFRNIAFSYYLLLYIALPFTLLTYFPYRVTGAWEPRIVFLPFWLVWINDTFAYLAGVSFGRHKLFPRVSPNKSWEGVVGGGLATLAAGIWSAPYLHGLTPTDTFIIAGIVVLFAIYGDLIESLFKRGIDIKDSGHFLPGHGGILDRLDALLFTLPAIFVYLEWKY